jgi:hypothetical protein
LGEARVFITPGQNRLEFTIHDSFGREATYTVANTPSFEEGMLFAGLPDPESLVPDENLPGSYLVNNRLHFRRVRGIYVCHEEIFEALTSVGGEIIGVEHVTGLYTIQLPPKTEEELNNFGESVVEAFPHLFRTFFLVGWSRPYGEFQAEPLSEYNDVVLNYENIGGGDYFQDYFRRNLFAPLYEYSPFPSPPTTDRFWNPNIHRHPYYRWGLNYANFPAAWLINENQERENVRIGIIDYAVMYNHEDLRTLRSNTNNNKKERMS